MGFAGNVTAFMSVWSCLIGFGLSLDFDIACILIELNLVLDLIWVKESIPIHVQLIQVKVQTHIECPEQNWLTLCSIGLPPPPPPELHGSKYYQNIW